jgi:hypothetical protein
LSGAIHKEMTHPAASLPRCAAAVLSACANWPTRAAGGPSPAGSIKQTTVLSDCLQSNEADHLVSDTTDATPYLKPDAVCAVHTTPPVQHMHGGLKDAALHLAAFSWLQAHRTSQSGSVWCSLQTARWPVGPLYFVMYVSFTASASARPPPCHVSPLLC